MGVGRVYINMSSCIVLSVDSLNIVGRCLLVVACLSLVVGHCSMFIVGHCLFGGHVLLVCHPMVGYFLLGHLFLAVVLLGISYYWSFIVACWSPSYCW